MKKIFLLIFLFPLCCFSQKQGNIWYFGNHAGIDFNTSIPTTITNGQTYLQNGHAEGTSVMSDSSGTLLFYSNGEKVWNSNHQVMPNGDSIYGSYSSSQSSLIIPLPGSYQLFYLFTLDDFNHNLQFGFRYSVIDMCLDGNLGDIIPSQKNILLLDTAGEKLTTIRHSNGVDYWIIVHKYFSDAFYAYLFTSTGISDTIITNIGSVHTTATSNVAGAIGYMKASPDGNRLALVSDNGGQLRELFDFNKSTGVVSNFINLHLPSDLSQGAYGVSFSPDNSKLYITTNIKTVQFDLNAGSGNADSIRNSKVVINLSSSSNDYALQLGPDGKIYVAQYGAPFLSVINNPNDTGLASNYISNAIDLLGQNCNFGLPNFNDAFDYSNSSVLCNVGIQENNNKNSFFLFPNPTSGLLNLSIQDIETKSLNLKVENILGQKVYSENIGITSGSLSKTINLEGLNKGMYLLKIEMNQTTLVRKFTLE
jgi:hypothetical protein